MGISLDSLAIPMIESTSSDIGFEASFTKIVRDKFISQGKVDLVTMEQAQAVLSGRVYEIRTVPLSYRIEQQTVSGVVTTFEETRSRRLILKLDMRLTDAKTGKVIWHEKAMEEMAIFEVSEEDPLVTQFNQRLALELIARALADRIFLKTMERF
jgi:PBP1b-binding outer membrane lipoprotein LpoB